MTKQMRKLGIQFHNRRNDDMFKVEHGVVYKLLPGGIWLMMPGLNEDKLLADDDVYYLNGGRVLAAVMFASICVALGFGLWGGL